MLLIKVPLTAAAPYLGLLKRRCFGFSRKIEASTLFLPILSFLSCCGERNTYQEVPVEIALTARHTTVSDRFRKHLQEKLEKIEHLGKRVDRVEVCVNHEPNPRQADHSERIEITVRQGKIVVRAEASAADKYSALDLAQDKLIERLRRARDRRKRPVGRQRTLTAPEPGMLAPVPVAAEPEAEKDYSPVAIRRKKHAAAPMSLDDALSEMELVGHDFFLFEDIETKRPCVVYRRRGWSYGVIELDRQDAVDGELSELSAVAANGGGALPQ